MTQLPDYPVPCGSRVGLQAVEGLVIQCTRRLRGVVVRFGREQAYSGAVPEDQDATREIAQSDHRKGSPEGPEHKKRDEAKRERRAAVPTSRFCPRASFLEKLAARKRCRRVR